MKHLAIIGLSSTLLSCNSLQSTTQPKTAEQISLESLEKQDTKQKTETKLFEKDAIDGVTKKGDTSITPGNKAATPNNVENIPLPVEVAAPVRQIIFGDLVVAGYIENIALHNGAITCQAKLDTGADNSSIGVSDIVEFEKDGKKWVKFNINFTKEAIKMSLPIKKITKIKRHNAESQTRIVVELDAKLGEIRQKVDFSLTSRDNFNYPVLLGRNFLHGKFLIDSSRTFIITEEK